MHHASPLLVALAFVGVGLASTSANAQVGVYVAPGTVAVSVGAPVVYAPPPPVVYAPPPTTVVYAPPPPATVVYRPVSYRPVVVHQPVCQHPSHHRDGRGPPAHARAWGYRQQHGHHDHHDHHDHRADRRDDHREDHRDRHARHHGRR